MGKMISSGLQRIIATAAGDAGAIAGAILAIPLPIGSPPQGPVKMVIRKIAWRNRLGINADILIGYGDRTVAGSIFRQVFPRILAVNGLHDEWVDPPIMGNTREGFMIDTTAVTGTVGDIYVESDTAGLAAGTPIEFVIEAELL